MIPELGYIALLFSLTFSIALSLLPTLGRYLRYPALQQSAFPLALALFFSTFLSVALLGYSFSTDDFSVHYVAQHSNISLDFGYKIAAIWGGHEGSMLFLLFSLTLWMCCFAMLRKNISVAVYSYTLSALALVVLGLCLFILLYSDPFERLFPAPVNGRDLNPMLQDIGLVLHPPLLYIGYSGFALNFGLAIATLIQKKWDETIIVSSRFWALASWSFLTTGILLGAWWAYGELGWGGWWFWDPVENVSLLPWLTGTALLHALVIAEKRGLFPYWTLLLSLLTFLLAILGTFVVRSGILTSIHAFAVDSERGNMLLLLLGCYTFTAFILFAMRANFERPAYHFSLLSHESLMLSGLLLFSVAAFTVALGTFYPLLLTILNMESLSVGAPYFNLTFTLPVMLAMIIMGFSAYLYQHSVTSLQALSLTFIALISLLGGCCIPLLMAGEWNNRVALVCSFSIWVVLTSLRLLFTKSGAKTGMFLAHTGVAICAIGAVLSGYYTSELSLRMGPGTTAEISRYHLTYENTRLKTADNYTTEQGQIAVTSGGQPYAFLYPERRHYPIRNQIMTEPGISRHFSGDMYAILGEKLDSTDYALRIYHKPFIGWVWLGALLMIAGGVFSLFQRRVRKGRKR